MLDAFLNDLSRRTFEAASRLLARGADGGGGFLLGEEARELGLSEPVVQAVDRLSDPIAEILRRGGKGWRGYTLALCCQLAGGDVARCEDWLAFTELLHVGSLIVDDVEDGADLRRGGPTCHLVHGPAVAINAGTLAYFSVQRLIEEADVSRSTRLAIYRDYVSLLRLAHLGQGLDLGLTLGDAPPDDLSDAALADIEARVESSHRLKSGVPFKYFARIGARLGAGREPTVRRLGDYFLQLGSAFQLVDELLDLTGYAHGGKTPGEDLRNGKWTIPVVRLLRAEGPGARRGLVEELLSARMDEGLRLRVLARFADHEITAQCRQDIRGLMRSELDKLRVHFRKTEEVELLRAFAETVLERHY